MQILEHGIYNKGINCPECGSIFVYHIKRTYGEKISFKSTDLKSRAIFENTFYCSNCGCSFCPMDEEDFENYKKNWIIHKQNCERKKRKQKQKRQAFWKKWGSFIRISLSVLLISFTIWIILFYYAHH